MPQYVEVPGYGRVRQFQGAGQAGRYRLCRLGIDFGTVEGLQIITDAISQMNLVKIRTLKGEASSMTLTFAIDTRGQRNPQNYARSVLGDIVDAIIAMANQTSQPSPRTGYKPVRTVAQRGARNPVMG